MTMTTATVTGASSADAIASIYNRVVRRRDLRPDDRLSSDPTLDSLKLLEFIVELEEHFDVDLITDDSLRRVETFAELTAHVDTALQCQN